MNKLLLLMSVFLTSSYIANTQPWKENLPKENRKKEVTLNDYQKAFNNYWKPYDLNIGYFIDKEGKKQKARGWKQFKRWEYYWETQVDAETGEFPEKTAYQVFQEFYKSKANKKSLGDANWTNLGTNSSSGGYAGIGRINCIAFHPTNNNIYWVGTPAGGLWVTKNNGASWSVLTDENNVLGVSDIVIPSDYEISKTIYIATGDRDAWDNRSIGVLKSTDDGITWNVTGISFTVQQSRMCTRLLLDPNNDNIIIAATSRGVYKTIDAGTTWSNRLTSLSFIDMEYKPGDFNTLYGSTTNGSVYYSSDGGINWFASLDKGERIELAVSPASDSIVYALASASDDGLYGVYKSTNSGSNFTEVYSSLTKNLLDWSTDGSGDGGQGWYDLAIAVSPSDEDVVVVGGVNTWRSTNGGTDFSIINHWYGGGGVQAVHADKHMLNFRSNGDLFECNDGGVYVSTNNGTSWTDKTNGIVNSQMYKLSVSQQLENEIITGLQDNGSKLYSDNKWWDVKGGDGMECLIDYADYKIQYATYVYGQITRTKDWWSTSTDIEPSDAGDGAWVTPFIIDPVNHNVLYAGYADVWKTTNNGTNWTKISNINASDKIRSMAIAPSNNNVLYVASRYAIYKTINGGSDWTNITSGLPSNFITYIAVKHNDPNTLWVSLGGYDINAVYQSTDGGSTWNNISLGLPSIPANTVVQDTNGGAINTLYLGTEAGVYKKVADEKWQLFNNGLPNVKIGELEIYYNSDPLKCKLRAATYGRGLWETPVIAATEPVLELTSIENITANGASATASITDDSGYTITESGFVISIFSESSIDDVYTIKVKTSPVVINGEYTLGISGLVQSSTYYIKAYAISQIGVGYSDEYIFETDCGGAISVLPYATEFAIDSLPNCWINIDNLGNDQVWQFDNPGGIGFISSTSDSGFASLNSENYGSGSSQNADLITPEFDFTNYTAVNISFEHLFKSNNGATAKLQYSLNNGTNWTTIKEWSASVGTTNAPAFYVKDISGIAGEASVTFSFNYNGANDGYWCIDDLLIANSFAVSVNVSDVDTIAIPNATVSLGEKVLTTNFAGNVMFRSVSNTTHEFSVSADGYVNQSGTVVVDNTNAYLNINLQTPPSTDASLDSLLVAGVMIESFNSGIFMYNIQLAPGTTDLPLVSAVTNHIAAEFIITQATLETLTATVEVTAEDESTKLTYYVIFEILPDPTYTVTFSITNENNDPVPYVTVSMLEMLRSADTEGVAIFTEVPSVGDTVFEVTSNEYNTYSGRVNIVDADVDVDVVLLKTGINDNLNSLMQVYPNPTSRFINIEIANTKVPAQLSVVDFNGKVVFKKTNMTNSETIDLKGNAVGVYFVNLTIDNETYTERVVLK